MKMMSKRSVKRIDAHLEMAKIHLSGCLRIMKGKYGTADAVSDLQHALIYINQRISDDKYHRMFHQQFRNPPNTPKSRRLGWYKCVHDTGNDYCNEHCYEYETTKGVNDEQ